MTDYQIKKNNEDPLFETNDNKALRRFNDLRRRKIVIFTLIVVDALPCQAYPGIKWLVKKNFDTFVEWGSILEWKSNIKNIRCPLSSNSKAVLNLWDNSTISGSIQP